MMRIWHEARFAFRGFRRTPAFFMTAVMIVALGIGMSVAMFTVFRTVLVRRLPVVDQDRLVVMWTYGADPAADVVTGTKDLSVVRSSTRTMREIAAVAHWPATSSPFMAGDRPVELNRGMVTGNFFDVLGVRPALGRLLQSSDDERPGSSPTEGRYSRSLVLSYRAWQEKFGGDSSVIGRHLVEPLARLNYTIVGVAPPGFAYPAGADYWIPMWSGWQSTVSAFAVARLAPGATLATAREEYLSIERRLSPQLKLRGAHAETFTDTVLGNARPVLALLTAAVGLLLLIACLNVGNLLLLRATSRTREIAVRRALGAAFGDILRQLLVEAAAIAIVGGVLGLAAAVWSLKLLVASAPANLPRVDDIALSGTPISTAIAVTSATVLIFGVIPALFTARWNLASPMRLGSRSGNDTRGRRAVRHVLVASQIALAMVMLGGAALLVRSLERLERQDTGFVSDHLSVLWYSWNAMKYDSVSTMTALGDQVVRRIRAIPGVAAATPMVAPPMLGKGIWQVLFGAEGQSNADRVAFATELCGPEFFKTFGIPILRGRAFTDDDRASSPLVAIVSSAVASRLWSGETPIGKRIHIPGASTATIGGGAEWRTVVGVAQDTHLRTLREPTPTVYLPSVQGFWQGSVAIRSTVDLAALTPALRAAAREVDPELELWSPQTMDQILAEPLAQPRLGALLMSSFGIVALLLAAIGLFGVMSALVRDRTRELAIRIALGATPGRVRGEVLARAALVAGVGSVIGLVTALATSRLFSELLYQVSPTDPIALGAACAVLLGVAAVAAYLPARRATSIDPATALRSD